MILKPPQHYLQVRSTSEKPGCPLLRTSINANFHICKDREGIMIILINEDKLFDSQNIVKNVLIHFSGRDL